MKKLKLGFTTFLKICTKKTRGKIGEVRRFTGSGGYDFYKAFKQLARDLAAGNIDLAQAKATASAITNASERKHTLAALENINIWLVANKAQWRVPPNGFYRSKSGLLEVSLVPELAFAGSNNITRVLHLWNLKEPELENDLAAEGLWLLADNLGEPTNAFEILNLRTGKIFTEALLTQAVGKRLYHNLVTIEEIWKDLHDPKLSPEDTFDHISSLKFPVGPPPPMPR